MSEALLRQRRNLFLACILLWVMKYGGVTFSKFALAGFDVEFARPEALILCVWIAYAYFLYRYYQYFSAEGVEKLSTVFNAALEKHCEPQIKKFIKRRHPDSNDAVLYSLAILRKNNWVYQGQEMRSNGSGGIGSVEKFIQLVYKRTVFTGVLRAIFDSTIRNSVVTDYLLPFALAGFVLWYCGSYDWRGSLFHFIFSTSEA